MFCAIHLAAAAEELLGKHLPEKDRIFTSAWRAEKALKSEKHPAVSDKDARKSVNELKNRIKHMGNGDDETVLIDPKLEALFYIEHAWINFNKLGACLLIPRPADCDSRVPNRISSGGQCSSERAAGRTGSDQRVVVLIPGEMGFEPLKPVGEPDAANSRIRFDVRLGGSFAAIVRCTVSEVAKLSRLRVRPGTGSAPGRASRYCGRGRRGPTRWRPSRRRARETDGSRAPA